MRPERRSLYRILHVQPEAPAEIITAAYRCLMTKLRHHPDLGGDHETAVLINEAYAVLGDAARRREYDRARHRRGAVRAAASASAERVDRRSAGRGCPFCGGSLPRVITIDTRCARCRGPLAPIAHNLAAQRELLGRRSATRSSRNSPGSIQTNPNDGASTARLRDLSMTGISVYTAAPVQPGSNVRICARGIDVVAHVVQVRPSQRVRLVHARLLTAHFTRGTGVFMSVVV